MIIFSLNCKTIEDLTRACENVCTNQFPLCKKDKINDKSESCKKIEKDLEACQNSCQLFLKGLTECQKGITDIVTHIENAQNQARE